VRQCILIDGKDIIKIMLTCLNISKSFGTSSLFEQLTFTLVGGDRLAVIGPNGVGKTTLFEIITGSLQADMGSVVLAKKTMIGYQRQNENTSLEQKLLDSILQEISPVTILERRIESLRDRLINCQKETDQAELVASLGDAQIAFEQAGGYNLRHEAERVLCGLGFRPSNFNQPLQELSGGWLIRARLARLLVICPHVLIMDEPTNHLDVEAVAFLEDYLLSYRGAIIFTSHDRRFINTLSNRVLSLEGGGKHSLFNGPYQVFLENRVMQQNLLQKTVQKQTDIIQHQQKFIERFRYKASKAAAVQSRIKMLQKLEPVENWRLSPSIDFSFPMPPPQGRIVLELDRISKSYGNVCLFQDLSLTIYKGQKIAVTGANGVGKTTLLKIMAGVLDFDGGSRHLGHKTVLGYYAQSYLETLNPSNDALAEMRLAAPQLKTEELRGLLGAFRFSKDDVYKKVEVLSGGEKARLCLAKLLVSARNLLLMDEPTNHLDISSREMLTDALSKYSGTLVFITHDRDLMSQLATRVIHVENQEITSFDGTYDEFISSKHELAPRVDKDSVKTERDFEKERKRRQGLLRNTAYKEMLSLKEMIANIESQIGLLEKEIKEIETKFEDGSPQGGVEIKNLIILHKEKSKQLSVQNQQWEEYSVKLWQREEKLRSDLENL